MTATAEAPAARLFDDRHTHTTLWHVIKSEWTKFWSVRSTPWTLLVLFVATVGISVVASWGTSISLNQMSPVERAQLDVVFTAMSGVALGQLAIAVLGALTITTEYSTGGIKTTFTAVPARMRVLFAKGVVLSVVALVVGLITTFVAFFLSMLFWNSHHLEKTLNDPGVLRAVIGGGLYILASGLFGFALGAVLRHTAGSITAAVGLLLVVPPLMQLLPGGWGDTVNKYFTSNAGSRIMSVVQVPDVVTPWIGYLTITIWWVVPLFVGAWLMETRDA